MLVSFLFFLAVLSLTGHFPPQVGTDNPSAKDILDGNADADILQLDGLVYSNVSNRDWISEREYTKGEKIGEIKKQTTNTWWFWNLYASKLPAGTAVYTANGEEYGKGDAPLNVMVKRNGEWEVYQSLREG